MKELIEYIVKSLVIDEDAVKVTEQENDDETVYVVSVAEDDMGRVIGKGGNVAASIRAIIKSISARQHKKVFVKFGE
jgi:hypothetical protein